MNKAPAFQFYVGDYLQDTRCLSLAARGAWTDCLCAMWRSSTRGEITYPLVGYARLFGCTVEQAKTVIDELVEMQTCDCVTHSDGKVALINRRMKREAKERQAANNRQSDYRERQKRKSDAESDGVGDAKVTTLLQSSSSSSLTNNGCGNSHADTRARGKPLTAANVSIQIPSQTEWLAGLQTLYPQHSVETVFAGYVEKCETRYRILPTREGFEGWLADQHTAIETAQKSLPKGATWSDAEAFLAKKYRTKGATNGT